MTKFRYLTDNFEPVIDEIWVENLPIRGSLPSDLHGIFMRNGPNPYFEPLTYTYPYDGDGMIHAIYIKNGQASYRNRFVATKELLAEKRAGKALYGGIAKPVFPEKRFLLPEDPQSPVKAGRFINVIHHAGRYIALHESNTAYEITSDLKTLGEWRPSDHAIEATPHVRFDPKTQELYLINYSLEPPYLCYHRLDAQGHLIQTIPIDMPYTSMMHDFVLTEHYVVFFDCAVLAKIENLMSGKGLFEWEPSRGGRIGYMPKDGSHPIVWIETPPFFSFHSANGFDQKEQIIIDYVHYDVFKLDPDEMQKEAPSFLKRVVIDRKSKKAEFITRDDRLIEFPRINDRHTGQAYQFIYSTLLTYPAEKDLLLDTYNAIIKYDASSHSESIHDFGKHALVGEPVFIPRSHAQKEDDGYIILFVYDKIRRASECVLLSAERIEEEPLARIQLPRRIPQGLHGSWMAGKS